MKKHLLVVTAIAVVLGLGLGYFFFRVNLVPDPGSTQRDSMDYVLRLLFSIAGFLFAIIMTVFIYSLIFFRQRPGDNEDGPPIRGNSRLELTWTIIPLVIVLSLAAYGGVVLNRITQPGPPQSEMEIAVIAQRFSWQFTYPEYNITSYELHVPVNQRLHFSMQSKDVIHSFWVQEWGPKQDIVPGITTEVRYTPNKTGDFFVQCSQLCGWGHTDMIAPVFVTSMSDFQTWVQQQQKATPTPTPSSTAIPTSTAFPTSTVAPVTINLTAQNIAFNVKTITVSTGANVVVNFNNQDAGTPHNFAVYTDSTASKSIFVGQVVTGPATVAYKFTAPATPGNYFFRCDVHPTIMTGTFVVK